MHGRVARGHLGRSSNETSPALIIKDSLTIWTRCGLEGRAPETVHCQADMEFLCRRKWTIAPKSGRGLPHSKT